MMRTIKSPINHECSLIKYLFYMRRGAVWIPPLPYLFMIKEKVAARLLDHGNNYYRVRSTMTGTLFHI